MSLEEVGGCKALSLESPLHVGDPNDHRVDVVRGDQGRQPVKGEAKRGLTQRLAPESCRALANSASMAFNSTSVSWTFGPVDHLRADNILHPPAKSSTTPMAIGVSEMFDYAAMLTGDLRLPVHRRYNALSNALTTAQVFLAVSSHPAERGPGTVG